MTVDYPPKDQFLKPSRIAIYLDQYFDSITVEFPTEIKAIEMGLNPKSENSITILKKIEAYIGQLFQGEIIIKKIFPRSDIDLIGLDNTLGWIPIADYGKKDKDSNFIPALIVEVMDDFIEDRFDLCVIIAESDSYQLLIDKLNENQKISKLIPPKKILER